jgi:hypothetical protein
MTNISQNAGNFNLISHVYRDWIHLFSKLLLFWIPSDCLRQELEFAVGILVNNSDSTGGILCCWISQQDSEESDLIHIYWKLINKHQIHILPRLISLPNNQVSRFETYLSQNSIGYQNSHERCIVYFYLQWKWDVLNEMFGQLRIFESSVTFSVSVSTRCNSDDWICILNIYELFSNNHSSSTIDEKIA